MVSPTLPRTFARSLPTTAACALAVLVLVPALNGCAGSRPRQDTPSPIAAAADPSGGPAHDCCATAEEDAGAVAASSEIPTPRLRIVPEAKLPRTPMVDQDGRPTTFAEVIDGDTPVVLDFVFTTCTTICPVMTATFARFHETVGEEGADVRLVSVSLDPEYDTPAVLRKYATTFGADERWTFLTGDLRPSTELYRRYEVLNGSNKMTHLPFALFRFPGDDAWVRVDGLLGAQELADLFREARELRSGKDVP